MPLNCSIAYLTTTIAAEVEVHGKYSTEESEQANRTTAGRLAIKRKIQEAGGMEDSIC